jgi:hypothetical protein
MRDLPIATAELLLLLASVVKAPPYVDGEVLSVVPMSEVNVRIMVYDYR